MTMYYRVEIKKTETSSSTLIGGEHFDEDHLFLNNSEE